MSDDFQTGLLLLFLFSIKHTLADYFMQTQRMLHNRSIYVNMGRLQHAGIHAAFSSGVVLIAGLPMSAAMVLFAFDGVVHFHIDWLKGIYSERQGHGPDDKGYWRAFGVDQLMHQLTYLVMIWMAVVWLTPLG